jgi:hypothetical protein
MGYYQDLTPYTYDDNEFDSLTLNVGWLDKGHEYSTGDVSESFVDRLWMFCRVFAAHTRGCHPCRFCQKPSPGSTLVQRNNEELGLGSAEIRVFGKNGTVYAAPNLIYHYVTAHHYRPPDEFIQAVLEGPQPNTLEYLSLVEPWVNKYSPWYEKWVKELGS